MLETYASDLGIQPEDCEGYPFMELMIPEVEAGYTDDDPRPVAKTIQQLNNVIEDIQSIITGLEALAEEHGEQDLADPTTPTD